MLHGKNPCVLGKTHVVWCISCSELTLSTNHVPYFEICALHGSGNLCDGLASRWNMVIPVMDYGFIMLWFQSHEMHACTTWWCSSSILKWACLFFGRRWSKEGELKFQRDTNLMALKLGTVRKITFTGLFGKQLGSRAGCLAEAKLQCNAAQCSAVQCSSLWSRVQGQTVE